MSFSVTSRNSTEKNKCGQCSKALQFGETGLEKNKKEKPLKNFKLTKKGWTESLDIRLHHVNRRYPKIRYRREENREVPEKEGREEKNGDPIALIK